MKQKIYLFRSPSDDNWYMFERNVGLAKYLAKITDRDFCGEYDPKGSETPPNDAYWFLHGPITSEDAKFLNISGKNFFGGITHYLYAQKSVFHLPLPGAEWVPTDFPLEFVRFLDNKRVLLPGFTVFTHEDAVRAYHKLISSGYIVRLKLPLGTGMKGQYKPRSINQLTNLLSKQSESDLSKWGVVLEANIVGANDRELDSLSGGWFEIDGEIYSYVGFMSFIDNDSGFGYSGTEMYLIKGYPSDLLAYTSPDYSDVAKILNIFIDANELLPGFLSTRCNYNFVRGKFDGDARDDQHLVLAATEPTFRPGGATAAEFLGKQFLDRHPHTKVVHVRSRFHWGKRENLKLSKDSVVFFDGTLKGRGNLDYPIQVYAEILTTKQNK